VKICVHNFCVNCLKNSIQPIFTCETFLALLDVDSKDVFPQLALAKTFELKLTSCAQNLEFVSHNLRLLNSYVYNLWWKPWTQHVKNTPCPCKLEGCVFTTCTTQNPWTQPHNSHSWIISPCQLHNGFIDDPCSNFVLLKVNDSIALQFVHKTRKLSKNPLEMLTNVVLWP
jgi:hypothetical protein